MIGRSTELIPVDEATTLEVEIQGSGEPVLLVQTALDADELLEIARQTALHREYLTVHCHRRGYRGSSPVIGAGSVTRDAADCAAVLTALGIHRAHILGLSYSGAVALQFARDRPGLTQSLVLIEPPPAHVPSAATFRSANDRLLEICRADGPLAALDAFFTLLSGPQWRSATDMAMPGTDERRVQDATTFFETDIPALLAWQFGADDARDISCPVVYVGGTDSGPFFAEERRLIHTWLPQAEDVQILGADHWLATTHAEEITAAVVSFLRRHPIVQ